MALKDINTRIARGIALLDQTEPEWRDKIVLSELRLQSMGSCVLGQVFGDFGTGTDILFNDLWKDDDGPAEAALHGFDFDPEFDETFDDYAELQAAWEKELSHG